jgi:hypothetical protein
MLVCNWCIDGTFTELSQSSTYTSSDISVKGLAEVYKLISTYSSVRELAMVSRCSSGFWAQRDVLSKTKGILEGSFAKNVSVRFLF